MRLRHYAPRTLDSYVSKIVAFAKHFGRSPDLLGPDEVRAFPLHLRERRVSWSGFHQAVCALRFWYGITLGRPEQLPLMPYGQRPKTLPSVPSPDEVRRLLNAAPPGRDRAPLPVAQGGGLRLSELLHLQVGDSDGARRVMHVRPGQGANDRLVPWSPRLLEERRASWRLGRPRTWLCPGPEPDRPISSGTVQRRLGCLVKKVGLAQHGSMPTWRHRYATHLREAGADLLTLQAPLGHRSLQTTAPYRHWSTHRLQQTPSLLDLLVVPRLPPSPGGKPEGQP